MNPIERLTENQGLALIDEANFDAFVARPGEVLVFFAGNPEKHREAVDVAVVLPELLAMYKGRLKAGVIAPGAEAKLQPKANVIVLPSLALYRDGKPLGVLARMRDWSHFVKRLEELLNGVSAAA